MESQGPLAIFLNHYMSEGRSAGGRVQPTLYLRSPDAVLPPHGIFSTAGESHSGWTLDIITTF